MQNYQILQCCPIDDFGAISDWLHGSGWVQALVQADIAMVGMADSLYRATHVMLTRKAHQIKVAALYSLQHHAMTITPLPVNKMVKPLWTLRLDVMRERYGMN